MQINAKFVLIIDKKKINTFEWLRDGITVLGSCKYIHCFPEFCDLATATSITILYLPIVLLGEMSTIII